MPISRVRSVMVVYIASITTSALTTAESPTSARRKTPRYGMLFSMLVIDVARELNLVARQRLVDPLRHLDRLLRVLRLDETYVHLPGASSASCIAASDILMRGPASGV